MLNKKKQIQALTWMNLRSTVLNERRHTKGFILFGSIYCIGHFVKANPQEKKWDQWLPGAGDKRRFGGVRVCVICVLVTQSCPTLCDPMDYSQAGSCVHGILQARILEWVAISFSRRSSQPRDQTWLSHNTSRFFTIWTGKESQDWKRAVFIPIPKKGNAKECSNHRIIALISHASKVMLKILQVRLQYYMNRELPDVQAGFRKGRGTRDQIANICCIIKKRESSRKTSTTALLTMLKTVTVWITTNCGKFLREGNTRTLDLPPEKSVCRSRSNS